MKQITHKLKSNWRPCPCGNDRSDLIIILEAARIALADADTFDQIAEELDIEDEELSRLRDSLEKYMNETH